jgi:hypothetical protein
MLNASGHPTFDTRHSTFDIRPTYFFTTKFTVSRFSGIAE